MSVIFAKTTKLVGTGSSDPEWAGHSIAMTTTWLFVGGPRSGTTGIVWVYKKENGVWTQKTTLVPTGPSPLPYFGFSLAISNESENSITLAVGCAADNPSLSGMGGAYAFVLNTTTSEFTQEAKLVDPTSSWNACQGYSIAVSGDSNTVLSGGFYDSSGLGAGFVFFRSQGTWLQQGTKLVGSDHFDLKAQIGISVALSSTGDLAILGANDDNSRAGSIFIFERVNSVWSQVGSKITPTDGTSQGYFGWSLALSADDNTLIVGGFSDNGYAGATWVFKRVANYFVQVGKKLIGTDGVGAPYQGYSVATNHNGSMFVVGGYHDNNDVGAFHVFQGNGSAYRQFGNKLVPDDVVGQAKVGRAVAMDGVGATIAVLGPFDSSSTGATWVFDTTIVTAIPSTAPTTAQPSVQPSIQPSFQPSSRPTNVPSFKPSFSPLAKKETGSSPPLSTDAVTVIAVIGGLVLLVLFLIYYIRYHLVVRKHKEESPSGEMTKWINNSNKNNSAIQVSKDYSSESKSNEQTLADVYGNKDDNLQAITFST